MASSGPRTEKNTEHFKYVEDKYDGIIKGKLKLSQCPSITQSKYCTYYNCHPTFYVQGSDNAPI